MDDGMDDKVGVLLILPPLPPVVDSTALRPAGASLPDAPSRTADCSCACRAIWTPSPLYRRSAIPDADGPRVRHPRQPRRIGGTTRPAPEAMARGNADLFDTSKRVLFMRECEKGGDAVSAFIQNGGIRNRDEQFHRLHWYGFNPCGEIIGHDVHCNLSKIHLNMIEPDDVDG